MATTKTTTRTTTPKASAAKTKTSEKDLLATIKMLQQEVASLRGEVATLRATNATPASAPTGNFVTKAQLAQALRMMGARGHQIEAMGL